MTSDADQDSRSAEGHGAGTPVVVGIGASAGGVRALQVLFDALPDKTGAAYVVVVHLDPQTRSEMPSILATRTRMPVASVGGPVRLQPDHVYVIPPDRQLRITNGEIAASEFEEPRGRRAPIDLFFRSLAERHGDGCAVILTGAGSDGAVGVRAVKEAGGIILVQDPNEAEYPSMPRSAIATGIADFVLPVRDLAARLVELVKDKDNGALSSIGDLDEEMIRRILAHVRVRTGHDFSKYKRATVLRRIARRIQVTRTDNLNDYYDFQRDHAEEAQALLGDLLISVTRFFRDSEAFDALKTQVLPNLFHAERPDDAIRVWVPGCATGEEAYTVAILLLEEASRHDLRPSIQVFGSDLDMKALAIAREGRYPAAIETDVSEERLRRFFARDGDHFRVRQELRDILLFATHSLLKDPPFSRVDLISCRNLLIYLDREPQEQVCSTFHYALVPGGFLLVGSAETADNPPGLFRMVDRKNRIFQSIAQGDKPRLLPRLLGTIGALHEHATHPVRPMTPSAALNEAAVHRGAIERLAPPSILVDRSHRVLHISDNAGRFLQPVGGPLSSDVVDLVRPELRFELRSALHRVFENPRQVLSLPIFVQFNGAPHRVFLLVKPVGDGQADGQNALVLFIEGEAVGQVPLDAQGREASDQDGMVRQLREELQLAQARLRMTREDSESANEELRAANEELQSINEEYRSTSEELETSKEELQSINEELQTVNNELKLKLEVVSRAHSDLQNLLAATDFGTLFLDSALRIKRFTQQVTELFSITPSDEGRPLTDFAHRLEYDDLINDARTVLTRLVPIRHEIHGRNDQWYDVRLRPYRTVEDKIDGVVITFMDITERRAVDQALRTNERMLLNEKRLVEMSRDPIFIWDFDDGILEWNRGSEELYGYTRQEALGKRKDKLLATTVPGSSFKELREQLLKDGVWTGEVGHRTKSGQELTVETRIVLEVLDGRRLALESTRDITDRRIWEERQRLLLGELTHRVRNTLTVVQSVAKQTLRSSPNEEFVERFSGRLAALANAHGLLVESEWLGADLEALARGQLAPYLAMGKKRVRIAGEPVSLPADLATPFGLVLHELATNAAKHGSLSIPRGQVELTWTVSLRNDSRFLKLVWRESGGPAVNAPDKTGFGSALIGKGIPDAEVTREFHADGLVCTIELPLRESLRDGVIDRQ